MQPGQPGDDGVRPEHRPSPAPQRPAAFPAEPAPPYRSYRPSAAAITALVAAALGFFCSLSTTSRTSLNDAQATCSYFDVAPLACGAVAAVASLVALVGARRPPHQPVVEVGIAALAIAVAALHVVRAFGIVGGPC